MGHQLGSPAFGLIDQGGQEIDGFDGGPAAHQAQDLGPMERGTYATGVYTSYIRSPVPSPMGLGWTATHSVHGRGGCQNETSRGRFVVIVEMERILGRIS